MSWKGFMRRLVIGKQAGSDFSASDLPKNRKQVLKFIYRHRALTLFCANLIFIIFAIPFIAWEILTYLAKEANSALKDAEYLEATKSLIFESNLLRIPFLMIASIGLAGMLYIVRKLCWNEPVSLWKDFGRGIKNSWKSFLGISLILGIYIFITEFIINSYASGGLSGFMGVFLLVLAVVFMVIMFIATVYAFGLSSLYGINFITMYKASFVLTFKTLWYNVLMVIVAFLPVAIFFLIPMPLFYYIGIFVVVFGGTGYSFTCATLFSMRNFDRFINKTSYPEFVDKGIYKAINDQIEDDFDQIDIEEMAKQLAQDPSLELGSEGEEINQMADEIALELAEEMDEEN